MSEESLLWFLLGIIIGALFSRRRSLHDDETP